MKTMYPAQANSPGTELSADISDTVTTIPVLDGSKLPAAPNLFTIGSDEAAETIQYTGKSGNSLTGCTRGFDGTTAKGWTTGAKVARYLTAYDINTLKENIEGISTETINKITSKPVSDLPADYPVGVSIFSLSVALAIPWKAAVGHDGSGDWTLVETSKVTGDYNIVQRVTFSNTAGVTAIYERTSSANNSWNGAWIKFVARSEFDKLGSDVTAHLADYVRQPAYAQTSGTATAYTVTLDPAPASISEGFGITIIPHVDSGANPTLKISSNAAIALKKQDGSAAEMKAGKPYTYRKVGSDFLASNGSEGVKINGQYPISAVYGETIASGDIVYGKEDFLSKLPTPTVAPPGVGRGVTFSPDGKLLFVSSGTAPYHALYKVEGVTFNKLPNFTSPPANISTGVDFSPDGKYLVLAIPVGTTENITVYRIDGETFTKLPSLPGAPSAAMRTAKFSSDGKFLAVGGDGNENLFVYRITSGDTFTKVVLPTPAPGGSVYGLAFSPNSDRLIIGVFGGRQFAVYKISESGQFTTLQSGVDLPSKNIVYDVAFVPNSDYIILALANTPFFDLFYVNGDTYKNLNRQPNQLPGSNATKISVSSSGLSIVWPQLSVAPYISFYSISDGQINLKPLTVAGPVNNASVSAFNPDNTLLAIGNYGDPGITLYTYGLLIKKASNSLSIAASGGIVGYTKQSGIANDRKEINVILK